MKEKKYLNFNEARELLNTSNGHLRSLVFKKQIPFIKLKKLLRFEYNDLIAWLNESKNSPIQDNKGER